MWTYIFRRLLYAVPILLGVLLLTYSVFFAIQSPEDLSRNRVLQKGGTENDVAADMRGQGYAELNEMGERKLALYMEAAADELTLDELREEMASLTYGKPTKAKRERPFASAEERIAYREQNGPDAVIEEDYLVFEPTPVVVEDVEKDVIKNLMAKKKKALRAKTSKTNEKDQATKDLIAATDDAKKALDAALLSESAEADSLQKAYDGAKKESDAALKVYNAKIDEIIKPELDAYVPTAKEIFNGFLESKEMGIGTAETYRYSWTENFWYYLTDLLTFTFRKTNDLRDVSEVLAGGMWPSLMLMIPAFFLSELLGVFFGLFSALFRGTRIDRSLVIASVVFMSVTPVAFIIFAQKFLAGDWKYFPVSGFEEGIGAYAYLALPILIYVMITIGSHIRFNRIIMLDEVGQDYVRTAKAKGVSRNNILFKHVLRNALIPLITRWAVAIPNLYLGSLLLESFFAIPGLGGITVQAVINTDINQIRALVFIGTIIYIFATLLSDVLYAVVDPRIKLG